MYLNHINYTFIQKDVSVVTKEKTKPSAQVLNYKFQRVLVRRFMGQNRK